MLQKKNKDKGASRRKIALMLRFLRGSKLFFLIAVVSVGITALMDMLMPQIIRVTVDHILPGTDAGASAWISGLIRQAGGIGFLQRNLWVMAAAVLLCALIKVISQYAFRVYNTKASETLVKTMRDTLFTSIEEMQFSWHMKNKTGDIIQRCTSDIDTLKNFVSEQMTSIFRIVLMLALSMVFMFSMDVTLTVVALSLMPVIMGYAFVFQRRISKGFAECDESQGKLSAMAQENLTGVRVVRAFGRERYEKDRFESFNEFYSGQEKKLGIYMARYWCTSDIIVGIQVMLLVVVGCVLCIRGSLTSGEYIAFISYNSMLIWPVRQLGRMLSELSKAGVSVDRIMHITESEKEQDRPGATDADMTGDIAFEHVSFGYEGAPELLHDIHFTMKAGTTLGILGGTGSGKSTMMLLLDKLYDLPEGCGRITIGGTDIRDIRTRYLRANIGIVLQEPYLFSRTIAQNIGITDPTLTLPQIRDAARAACLDDSVQGFANGYDTMVGERGVTLSGGQKQRAAIARNLTRNTPIMIFDDSLSAVDTETDAKIRAELEKRFGSASIILISHRITTLSKADWILVLENGRIVQQGTHEQLKSCDGIYKKIYETQTGAGDLVG